MVRKDRSRALPALAGLFAVCGVFVEPGAGKEKAHGGG